MAKPLRTTDLENCNPVLQSGCRQPGGGWAGEMARALAGFWLKRSAVMASKIGLPTQTTAGKFFGAF